MAETRKLSQEKLELLNRINLPDGISIDSFWDSFIITRQWYSPKYIAAAVFAVIWNGFLLSVVANAGIWIYLLPHGWIGIWLAYYALTHLFNTTVVVISATDITISHHPIPYPDNKKLNAENVRQLYVKSKRNRNGETYQVRVITDRDKDMALLDGIDQMTHALMIEQTIEEFLGIEDKLIGGEIGGDPAVYKLSWSAWEKFARKNQFDFVSGKYLEAYGVHGVFNGRQFKLFPRSNPMGATMQLSNTDPAHGPGPVVLSLAEVEKLFKRPALKGKMVAKNGGMELFYEQNRLETDSGYLQSTLNLMDTLLQAYPKIVNLGAEAIPLLEPVAVSKESALQNVFLQLDQEKDHPLQAIAATLIAEISHRTKILQPYLPRLWCKHCLAHFVEHAPQIAGMDTVTYCGCRLCHQSREYYTVSAVIAVLDSEMENKPVQQGQTLRVNWLTHRALFDFDTVEIVRATDEDVERFVVQVGNDTDPQRQPHYKNMTCRVACQLSPNSARILARTFGQVTDIAV